MSQTENPVIVRTCRWDCSWIADLAPVSGSSFFRSRIRNNLPDLLQPACFLKAQNNDAMEEIPQRGSIRQSVRHCSVRFCNIRTCLCFGRFDILQDSFLLRFLLEKLVLDGGYGYVIISIVFDWILCGNTIPQVRVYLSGRSYFVGVHLVDLEIF